MIQYNSDVYTDRAVREMDQTLKMGYRADEYSEAMSGGCWQ